jgi:hypothetical protein
MDVYLPADFYRLRDDLPEWRDAPETNTEKWRSIETVPGATDSTSRNECADPLWQVI